MVNINKLKAKAVELGMTTGELAEKSGIPRARLYRRLASNGEEFTISEVSSLATALECSRDEVHAIFLPQFVA